MTDTPFDKEKWDYYLLEQNNICKKLNVELVPIEPFSIVGISLVNISSNPFHALRHPPDNYSGWFLWTEEWNKANDFFKSIHSVHLLEYRPEILKYLGLPTGSLFHGFCFFSNSISS